MLTELLRRRYKRCSEPGLTPSIYRLNRNLKNIFKMCIFAQKGSEEERGIFTNVKAKCPTHIVMGRRQRRRRRRRIRSGWHGGGWDYERGIKRARLKRISENNLKINDIWWVAEVLRQLQLTQEAFHVHWVEGSISYEKCPQNQQQQQQQQLRQTLHISSSSRVGLVATLWSTTSSWLSGSFVE